jgi:WS/DGAT/MGAT family acyltransferase
VEPTDRVQHTGSHLSEVEALMWTVDRDPVLSATFGSITVLDRYPDMALMTARMGRAMAAAPRLRQRIVDSPNPFTTPQWCDDPDPDTNHHLRQVSLAAPGSMDQLYEFAATVIADPFDRTRPLWQFWVVDGLAGGRAALVLKMHHTITDGVGGVRLWEQFIDFERHDAHSPDPGHDISHERNTGNKRNTRHGGESGGEGGTNDGRNTGDAQRPAVSSDIPGDRAARAAVGVVTSALGASARHGIHLAQRSTSAVLDLARHPGRTVSLPGRSIAAARSTIRQVVVTDGPRSPLWADRTMHRAVRTADISLADARAAAHRMGGTINDLFVTAVTGAAGAYHRQRGATVTELRMAMPVSVRRDKVAGGNAFVPTRMLVPADESDPVHRFRRIHELLSTVRGEPVLALGDMVATVANVLPSAVAVRLARQQVGSVDFTTSNVRASPTKLYIGGSRIEATYPLGPLGGTAFNASMLSYAGTINLGVHIDSGAVDDPELLMECILQEFRLLLDSDDNPQ